MFNIKLQNIIISQIHFNTFGGGFKICVGDVIIECIFLEVDGPKLGQLMRDSLLYANIY